MKKLLTVALALTAFAGSATAALADDHRRGHDRRDRDERHGRYDYDNRDDRRDERRAYRQGYREGRRVEDRRDDRRYYAGPRYAPPPVYYAPPRPRYWSRGHVLPHDYRRYAIHDPYRYGLYAPPRGHGWAHVGNDAYLYVLGSGLIVQVLRDSYY